MDALATAFGVVLVAELGDKSMIFSLAAATRYRWWMVLLPVAVASALLAAIAVVIGEVAGQVLGETLVALVAAGLFVAFGIWTWRSTSDAQAIPQLAEAPVLRTMGALGLVFFVAELGDKSQVATLAVAGIHDGSAMLVWMGATAGMVATNAIGIAGGGWIRRRLAPRILRVVVATILIGFGVGMLAVALR